MDNPHDVLTALRNTLKLGGSLLLTYGIALSIRMVLPRYLGPEAFGGFNWADNFSTAFFVATTLGIDTYIRKEVPVRPEHASDFFGGTLVLRVGMTLLLYGAMGVAMHFSGEPEDVRRLVYVFAGSQLFVACNNTLSAVLHARERVDGLSVVNVVTKVVWGGGLFAVMAWRAPLPWLALPQLASELVKMGVLYRLARRHARLVFRVDMRATRAVLSTSLPFFLTAAALAANGPIAVTLLGLLASKAEVGWYGGAWGIAGLTMLVTPIIGWVLMPLLSRAAARSEEELTGMIRRAMEATLAFSIPMTLAISVGADFWIRLMFGPAFAPAALALRILAPMFVLIYVSITTSVWLMIVNKAWTVTATSVLGLVLNPLLSLLLIRPMAAAIGPSGAAAASATAMVATETVVASILILRMGRLAFDRRNLVMLAKTLAICAGVVVLDHFLIPCGPIRLLGEATLYTLLVLLTGAVRVDSLLAVVRLARSARAQRSKPGAAGLPT